MSARRTVRNRRAGTRDHAGSRWPTRRSQTAAGAAYVLSMAAVAAIAAWPIYASGAFLLVAVAGVAVGALLAVASLRWAWAGWLTVLSTAGAALIVGVLLAVPDRPLTVAGLPAAAADVLRGVVTGWKDLVTVDLPVGGYRNLLVPALVIFVVGTVGALRLAWARTAVAVWAAPVALGMVAFGLLFGSTSTSAPLVLGALVVPAPVEMVVGMIGLVLSVGWLTWLAAAERRRALRRAADSSGVRVARGRSASDLRRMLLAGAMVLVSVAAAAIAGPALAADRSREVLRSATGPELDIRQAVSPLAVYRDAFTDARIEDILFTVDTEGALPDRVRLATLTSYDGEVFRALDPASSVDDARYIRVPSTLDAGEGSPVSATVTVDALRGIWLPTVGQVERVRFLGDDAASLADAFYYSERHQAGVETATGGLDAGDRYVVEAVEPVPPPLSTLTSPGVAASLEPPESLVAWVEAQAVGTDGAALDALISRLRERGYLSHALAIDEASEPQWMADLDGYVFQPSAAGHSLARIDALFDQLVTREAEARGEPDASLVAAVGDEEQFAVAAALLAQHLGFPARVVVGARLGDAGDLPACAEGVCRAGDLAAWVEVQSAQGEWIAVDATPQHAEGVLTEVRRQRDPEVPTEVRPETAQEVIPPDPVQQDSTPDSEDDDVAGFDWGAFWEVARIAGIGLFLALAALGPFLVVVGAKASRRRARRTAAGASARVVGGWDEYIDATVDHGAAAPGVRTRSEVAEASGSPAVGGLAVTADRAVFSEHTISDDDAAAFWRIVDDERRRLRRQSTVWGRIAAAVSLTSFTRSLSAGEKAGPSRGRERKGRSGGGER